MTRVDFYILDEPQSEARFQFACKLAEKIWRLGHQIYIHTADEKQAQRLDKDLWAFRADSFVPHHIGNDETGSAPITLGWDKAPEHHHDVLINLSSSVPSFFSRFERVTEIVSQDEETRNTTRKNYAFYRDRGYPMHNHDLRKKP